MRSAPAAIAFALALASCSGAKTYPNEGAKNLEVQSRLGSGVSARLHVHEVDAACRTEHRGSVALDRPSVAVSLPTGRMSYLVVTFDTSSFFGGTAMASAGTLLGPRGGFRYELGVSYRDGIYDLAVREIDTARGASRQIARSDPGSCKPR